MNYIDRLIKLLETLDFQSLEEIVLTLKETRSNGNTIFVAGNGGSSALASHFATDVGVGGLKLGQPTRVFSLNENMASLTATANDISYDQVFAKQIEFLGKAGDALICISSSGNSQNLIEACQVASNKSIRTIGILGFDGGKLRDTVDNLIVVKSILGDYGPVEDCHSAICHLIAERLRSKNFE